MGQSASVPSTTYEVLAEALVRCGADPWVESINPNRSNVCFVAAGSGNSGVLEAIIRASIDSGQHTLKDYTTNIWKNYKYRHLHFSI